MRHNFQDIENYLNKNGEDMIYGTIDVMFSFSLIGIVSEPFACYLNDINHL